MAEKTSDEYRLDFLEPRDGESQRDEKDIFDSEAYWSHLGVVFGAICTEATKLSMAFSQPPTPEPEEYQPLIAALERATLTLVSTFYAFPKSQGVTLRKSLKLAVLDIVESVKSLAQNIADYSLGSQQQLQATGIVWQDTDVLTSLPKDNKTASLVVVQETADLVRDALTELQEAVDTEGEVDDIDDFLIADGFVQSNQDTWTDADKEVLAASMGLIKTVKSVLKKTKESVKQNGQCDSEGNIAQLDDLVDHMSSLSPLVDNLASSLYPPMSYQNLIKQTDQLFSSVENSLHFLRHSHVTCEGDEQWLEFLLKANVHNKDKIHSLVSKT